MVNTRSSTSQENTPNLESLSKQLSVIASKLNTIDLLAAEVATLKAQNGCTQEGETTHRTRNGGKSIWREEQEDINRPMWTKNPSRRPHTMMEFPRFEGGDPRGWILKAEKYFCYYQTQEKQKFGITAMYPEVDTLDLFSWINRERTLLYWKEIVKASQENYGPAEFQNLGEHLCSIQEQAEVATLKAQNGCTQEGETTHRTRNGGKSIWREEQEDINRPMWTKNPSRRPHTMMEFPRFEGGDPRGWILKAEKYFCYYQTQEKQKFGITAMYPEVDTLDLFSWINRERTLLYWKEMPTNFSNNLS
ncbi:hypothetical protein KY290_036348 [Solanum tuberosum]|uniref:Retrotransposon protein n=1 Tax=Solanum tuberosum TaxID=4113 RepID=A0ABQ7TUD9_SOLTU|nr:hypothetical protein KY290_036348 [Solanum tuberosum]